MRRRASLARLIKGGQVWRRAGFSALATASTMLALHTRFGRCSFPGWKQREEKRSARSVAGIFVDQKLSQAFAIPRFASTPWRRW